MGEAEERVLRVDIPVREERVAELLRAGISPTEFAKFVLDVLPLEEWIESFRSSGSVKPASSSLSEYKSTVEGGVLHSREDSAQTPFNRRSAEAGSLPAGRREAWSEESFCSYLDVVAATNDLEEPMFLLAAYNLLGPSPTSSELQRECRFTSERLWQEKLRVAKTRLTVQARKMGRSPLFPRAQTTDSGRLHPISPNLYPYLKKWFDAKGEEAPTPSEWGAIVEEVGRVQDRGVSP